MHLSKTKKPWLRIDWIRIPHSMTGNCEIYCAVSLTHRCKKRIKKKFQGQHILSQDKHALNISEHNSMQ